MEKINALTTIVEIGGNSIIASRVTSRREQQRTQTDTSLKQIVCIS